MFIAINKPKGPSSFKMISQIRKMTGIKKVGHAGTLDPLASGVLVVAIGRESTRQLSSIVGKEKEYVAEVRLGYESTTDDSEGDKAEVNSSRKLSRKDILIALDSFKGEILQIPPRYSAIKVGGKRAYKAARQGKDMELKPRKVLVKNIKILKYKWPILELKIITGQGTYIRSIARDLGRKLGSGAYLSNLIRTRVGDYTIKKAINLENKRQIKKLMPEVGVVK